MPDLTRGGAMAPWQRQLLVTAVSTLRQQFGTPPADPKMRAVHDALLEVLAGGFPSPVARPLPDVSGVDGSAHPPLTADPHVRQRGLDLQAPGELVDGDLADVRGQLFARRALEVAAAELLGQVRLVAEQP